MIHETAKWVRAGKCESPIIFGSFEVPEGIRKAVISICGLGLFELYINGQKVGNDLLTPAWTDYEPRENRRLLYPLSDTCSHRVLYLDYNLMDFIRPGVNEIAVWLGNGWYNQHERNIEGDLWYELPKLAYTIELTGECGSSYVLSDENLRWKESPIVFNNVYFGEKWDFSLEGCEESFPVEAAEAPKHSKLMRQTCPPDREIRTIVPREIKRTDGRAVYDAGENISGFAVLTGRGRVRVRYAENIDGDNELNFDSTGGTEQIQTDEYVSEGWREMRPKFSWKAFRYLEISGEAKDVAVAVVHSDVKVTSGFESSDEILNWLYDAYVRTQLNNMHCGVVSDCPHRERLGYTGDGQLTCNAAMLLMDSRELYRKWIGDIMDCQDVNTGHVQHTAPFYGGGGGPGGWGCAVVHVPYTYYRHYGDAELLRECWPHMLKWIDYMESRSENGLVMREEKDGWCLGDWCVPDSFCRVDLVKIPVPLVNTYFLIRSLKQMQEIAAVIGCESAFLQEKIDRSMAALREAYCGKVGAEDQGAEFFLADLGLCDAAQCDAIADSYAKAGQLDTGIFGTYVGVRWLFENGYEDTAMAMLTSRSSEVSFHRMKEAGATTIWEDWAGSMSHDHPMFGGVADALFECILGIRALEPGYERVEIAPKIPSSLEFVRGHVTVPAGEIHVDFDRKRSPNLIVTIPELKAVYKGAELKPGRNEMNI